ncbi:MAG: ADP-ribosylation factor-like protein [Promethearchaeota archaeon]
MVKKGDSENKRRIRKILIMGLANSGKSSILMCLRGVKNLPAFAKLNPTKGLDPVPFEILGTEFAVWDFAGQEQYRNEHIRNFTKYAYGANKLIYVIDIQNKEQYEESVNYLKKIINLVEQNKMKVEISIFLHKYDPDLEQQGITIDDEIIDNLIRQLKDLVPSNLNSKIFKTSIYTLFQKMGVD